MNSLKPYTGSISDLQFRNDVKFDHTPPVSNALTFAIQALLPSRATPRMLQGLKAPHNPLAGVANMSGESMPSVFNQSPGSLTNEQMTAAILQQAMAMRR